MKLYVVMFQDVVEHVQVLYGVFDNLERTQGWIKSHFVDHHETVDIEWDDELLTDGGYGPFVDKTGCIVKYEIYERWLNEVRDLHTCVASYVSYDINNKKVLEEEHIIIDDPSDFEAYSRNKEAHMKDHSKVVYNTFNEFRYLDEDAKVLYYTYLEVFSKRKEVTDGSNNV